MEIGAFFAIVLGGAGMFGGPAVNPGVTYDGFFLFADQNCHYLSSQGMDLGIFQKANCAGKPELEKIGGTWWEVCSAEEIKDSLFSLNSKSTSSIVFSELAKNSDGTPKLMNLDQAAQYCADHKSHLPTAREIAKISKGRGADGLLERMAGLPTQTSSSPILKAGYKDYGDGIRTAKGCSDRFYYSSRGYRNPEDKAVSQPIWGVIQLDPSNVLQFDEQSGQLSVLDRSQAMYFDMHRAVRCIENP